MALQQVESLQEQLSRSKWEIQEELKMEAKELYEQLDKDFEIVR